MLTHFHLTLIFSIILFTGCAVKNIPTLNQIEVCSFGAASRSPSNLCKNVPTEKTGYLSPEMSRKIEEAFENLKLEYNFIPEVLPNVNSEINAINHYKDLSKNQKLLQTYKDAGFTVSKFNLYGTEHLFLRSPENIKDIFRNLIGLILNAEPDVSKIVLPALLFQRGTEFKLSRPGFDAIPSKAEGWQLVTRSVEIDNYTFAAGFADGKLALTVDPGFFFHDVTHLVDGAEKPSMMRLLRIFYGKIKHGDKDLSLDISDPNIGLYINEFLITANIKNIPLIENLILDRVRLPEPQKRIELQSEIRSNKFWQRLDSIHENIFQILEIHGGAALDGYNLRVQTSSKLRETTYKYAIGEKIQKGRDFRSYLTHDSFWGLIKQMLLIKAILTKNFDGFSEFASAVRPNLKKIGNEVDEQMKQRLELTLITLFLELEMRMGMALKYQVSGERIIEDLMSPDYRRTKTYKFFNSIARPEGLEEQLFVKP